MFCCCNKTENLPASHPCQEKPGPIRSTSFCAAFAGGAPHHRPLTPTHVLFRDTTWGDHQGPHTSRPRPKKLHGLSRDSGQPSCSCILLCNLYVLVDLTFGAWSVCLADLCDDGE